MAYHEQSYGRRPSRTKPSRTFAPAPCGYRYRSWMREFTVRSLVLPGLKLLKRSVTDIPVLIGIVDLPLPSSWNGVGSGVVLSFTLHSPRPCTLLVLLVLVGEPRPLVPFVTRLVLVARWVQRWFSARKNDKRRSTLLSTMHC